MTINLPLIDGYKIKSDKYQYILVSESNGREYNEGYYSTLQQCVQAFIDMKIRGFEATSIHSLIQDIKALETRLYKVLQPLNLRIEVSK